jgi:hypothetical protein
LPTTCPDPSELRRERLVGDDHLVETIGDLARHPRPLQGHPGGEVASPDLGENAQQQLGVDDVRGYVGYTGDGHC